MYRVPLPEGFDLCTCTFWEGDRLSTPGSRNRLDLIMSLQAQHDFVMHDSGVVSALPLMATLGDSSDTCFCE